MVTKDKARENRLRRKALQRGFRLTKSWARDRRAPGYGLYALIGLDPAYTDNPTMSAPPRTAPRVGTQKHAALAVWQQAGRPLTSDEASAIAGQPYDHFHKRTSELVKEGWLIRTGVFRTSRRSRHSPQHVLQLATLNTAVSPVAYSWDITQVEAFLTGRLN
jgi:hypothetical protein